MAERRKVIVLDDDPTGSQTVHSAPLLLRWDAASLRQGLRHASPLLFVLANTRALEPEAARARIHEICRTLRAELTAAQATGELDRWLIVSRGDSTLRGHFPLEVEAIAAELGPFDATLIVPAFLPGGRTTRARVHYLHGQPVHTTPFARDRFFGFGSSDLAAWVEEKTQGRIAAASVQHISLAELEGPPASLQARLASLRDQQMVVVDAERQEQLEALGAAIWAVCDSGLAQPRRLLMQSAASLINGLVPLPPQPLDAAGLAALRRRDRRGAALPALVMVGSHVPLADQQLERLLQTPGCRGLELPVHQLARILRREAPGPPLASLEHAWLLQLRGLLADGLTPVLFTSRGELNFPSAIEQRRFGLELAALMARLAGGLAPELGLVISKGGITTNTLLADGLDQAWVELQGQLLPGLSLVMAGDLPVVTFPGNLGDAHTLKLAWQVLTHP